MEPETIQIKNAREHNLQSVCLTLPRNSLVVFTGVSGSGKSSLAFDTLYAEGQRRYIESLSSYAREFMGQLQKPDCDLITGLSPAIAIQQKTAGWNPRSTVGTITAVYDFLRLLYARVGVQHCTSCGRPISTQSREQIIEGILRAFGGANPSRDGDEQSRDRKGAVPARTRRPLKPSDDRSEVPSGQSPNQEEAASSMRAGTAPLRSQLCSERPARENAPAREVRVLILAPVARSQKGEFRDLFDDLIRAGYVRARVDDQIVALREDLALQKNQRHNIEVVIDRLRIDDSARSRLAEAVENALRVGGGTLIVAPFEEQDSARPTEPGAGGQGLGFVAPASRRWAHGRDARATEASARGPIFGDKVFSSKYACSDCSVSFEPPTPQMFSFNSPSGMCMTCDGLGEMYDFDPELLVPDPSLSFLGGCIAPMRGKIGRWRRHIYQGVADAIGFDLDTPWKDLPKKAREALLDGTGDRHITYTWRWSGGVWKHGDTFGGVIEELRDKYRKAKASFIREYYEQFMRRQPCPDCRGGRLNEQALAVRLPVQLERESLLVPPPPEIPSSSSAAGKGLPAAGGARKDSRTSGRTEQSRDRKGAVPVRTRRPLNPSVGRLEMPSDPSRNREGSIPSMPEGTALLRSRLCSRPPTDSVGPTIQELCSLSVADIYDTLSRLDLTPVQQVVVEEVMKELRARIEFLLNVGLHYLTLDRTAPTLAGGEMQRIRLAGQIGSGLVGVLYILDEPSIGLHARDNERLLESLRKLQQMGNTVVVVEHDEATMRAADYVVDFGPGPGVRGGKIVAAGTLDEVLACKESITAQYLNGRREIEVPKTRRPVRPAEPRADRSKRPRRSSTRKRGAK